MTGVPIHNFSLRITGQISLHVLCCVIYSKAQTKQKRVIRSFSFELWFQDSGCGYSHSRALVYTYSLSQIKKTPDVLPQVFYMVI